MSDGYKLCPICKSKMFLMGSGKGYRCSKGAVQKRGNQWVTTGCAGILWNKSAYKKQDAIVRALKFPVIKAPTEEQKALRHQLSLSPIAKGSRLIIADAGPGTAKTTSVGWSMEAVYHRLGFLGNYGMRAFNKNAADLLLSKLPVQVPDVATLHSAGKSAQGARGWADTGKINRHFATLVENIAWKERPSIGRCRTVLERSRNLCLWTTADDVSGWAEIIGTVLARFPSLTKKCANQEKHLLEYIPQLAEKCLSDSQKFDFSDMITRPVTLAMAKTGWRMPCQLVLKSAKDWTDADVCHFAKLIRTIELPSMVGLVIDEGQDLDLAQIAVILAQTWRTGELTLVGDDRCGEPGEAGWKAGQAIYGWRGAFSGSLALIARLWKELTGESPILKPLTVTFRHGPEICNAYRPLNSVIRSALPQGTSAAHDVNFEAAFRCWIDLPEGKTALWITRTNAAITPIFLETLRNHTDCCLRGGPDFGMQVTDSLYESAGACDENGEFQTELGKCLANLEKNLTENDTPDPNSLEKFMFDMGTALTENPELLNKAKLDRQLSVGNLRRFVMFFADRSSWRVISNVYRVKGDEADLSVVDDVAKFNESWGDSAEDMACRHVALSRAKKVLLTIGSVSGSDVQLAEDNDGLLDLLDDGNDWE